MHSTTAYLPLPVDQTEAVPLFVYDTPIFNVAVLNFRNFIIGLNMMAVETQNSDSLLRPTDLSLKGRYMKEMSNSPSPTMKVVESLPYISDHHQQWRNLNPEALPPPMALVYGSTNPTAVTPTMPLDSMAKLVVLESFFSRLNPSPVGGRLPSRRRGSDNESDKFPVTQPILEAAKGLTELKHGVVPSGKYSNADEFFPSEVPASTSVKSKPCKRKGGWKFHDFSDESECPGKKKRMYSHNRLENDIIQVYQDRVTIKEVPTAANGSPKPTERLVVVEPSYISDPQLIKCNTSLRIVLDKKQGIYRLQVLPHTIEQGSLTNKSKVLNAVSKMLGENGSVLCPGIMHARLPPVPDMDTTKQQLKANGQKNYLGFAPATSNGLNQNDMSNGGDKYRGRWKMSNNFTSNRSLTPPDNTSSSTKVSPTDKLLMTLNKELSETQRQTSKGMSAVKEQSSATECLLWHVPPPNGKGKKTTWPEEVKWCNNCLKKMKFSAKSISYPRTSST